MSHDCVDGWGPTTRRSFPREAFPRDNAQGYVSARCDSETNRAEKIGALSDRLRVDVRVNVYTVRQTDRRTDLEVYVAVYVEEGSVLVRQTTVGRRHVVTSDSGIDSYRLC